MNSILINPEIAIGNTVTRITTHSRIHRGKSGDGNWDSQWKI
jgi:hypothetical protein